MLDREELSEEGAGLALEKALMFTLDAYSSSGLVSDEEIVQRLQAALGQFRRKSVQNVSDGIEAYVLLNCDLGLEDAVIRELMGITEVTEVKGVFGVYDFVVKIHADSEDQIKRAIAKVRAIDKIKSSLTMMVIESRNSSITN